MRAPQQQETGTDTPLISLEAVSVRYPNGHSALEGISLDMYSGTICGLVGLNGAGKSTLFKAMMGFAKPTHGRVTITGGDVRAALKANRIAYVPQTEDVDWNFPVLVEDIVMMGRYGHMGFLRRPGAEDRAAVDRALARTDIGELRKRQIGELSGGQRKRVFLARALAQGGDIMLLDEPFTGVDIRTERAIVELLRELANEGRLIIVSTHNLGSVPNFCDTVMLINQTLLAYGDVETTFTRDNLARAFGGMLRDVNLGGEQLHADEDTRGVSVLTDDERPLVFYGDDEQTEIVKSRNGDRRSTSEDTIEDTGDNSDD
jgi:manganese/iron transport system ATP-binding protein